MSLLAEHTEDPALVPVAIETDKNLIVVALQAAGLAVFATNPWAVARYRERYGQSGKKSDPGDAALLADVLRTDRHQHRQLPMISPAGLAVKALARQHQEAIWALHLTTSRLRSVLLEFYPQALKAFPNLKHKAALTVLAATPTPELGSKLTPRKLVRCCTDAVDATTRHWSSRSSPISPPRRCASPHRSRQHSARRY